MDPFALDLSVIALVMALYVAAIITPGPSFLFMSRLSLQGRRVEGAGATVGIAFATTVYALMAMTGLAVLLDQARWLARGVQIFGGLYLIYLGIQAWRSSSDGPDTLAAKLNLGHDRRDFWSGFRLGALVAWSNPKSVLFFVSLYAAAIPIDASVATKGAILAGGTSLELLWNTMVVVVLSGQRASRVYRRATKGIERVIGTVLAYFGARLILDRT